MTASDIRKAARENLAGNWGISVGVTLVAVLLGGVVAGDGSIDINVIKDMPAFAKGILFPLVSAAGTLGLVAFIIGGVIELGHARFLLQQCRREPLSFSTLFSQFDRFGTGFAQKFLRMLYIALWSLLLVIPGIIKGFSYAMTPFILEEHPEMTASQAINASKAMMDGHKMDLFVLELTFFGWYLLSALTLGIGLLFVNPYLNAAVAVFYRDISRHPLQASYAPPVEF